MIIRPQVIHIHAAPPGWQTNPDYVYIGRAVPRLWLEKSIFANPFVVGKHGTPKECVEHFRRYWRAQCQHNSEDRAATKALDGKKLVCWCKKKGDEPCHGDPIADLCEELNREGA